MDIQRTRTASETGTGGQFDTKQRHSITAVADKTQSEALLFHPQEHHIVSQMQV